MLPTDYQSKFTSSFTSGGFYKMASTLSSYDKRVITSLKKHNILQSVEANRIDESEGAIMVTCADGDQFFDVFQHHSDVCKQCRDDTRIHVLALNGGAKLIAHNSTLDTMGEGNVLMKHIAGAMQLKKITTVVLYAHAPCGAAYLHGVSFDKVLDLLFGAKERIKKAHPHAKVACFCHIADGDKKRTYFVSRDSWLSSRSAVLEDIAMEPLNLCH